MPSDFRTRFRNEGGWFVVVVFAGLITFLIFLAHMTFFYKNPPESPRFYETDAVPGYICVYDRYEGEIVPNTCKERKPG